MCDCLALTDQALAKTNEQLRVMFSFDGTPPRLYVETTPIEKRRGQKDRKLLLEYCPWCGVKYGEQEATPSRTGGESKE